MTPGSLIRPGQRLGVFIDPSVYEMEVSISKSILPSLNVGEHVLVRDAESHEDKADGKIIRINGSVDRLTQTVKVFIELRGKDLKEGMWLEAIMNGQPIPESVEISRSLLVDESKVYVLQDSALHLVDVEPVFFNQKTVVVKGLKDGQTLIAKAVPGAYSGMEVKKYQGELK